MISDVTERRRAQDGVAECMQQNVSVRVPEQTEPVGNVHSPEDEFPAWSERVNIIPDAHPRDEVQ